jgi:hypothetical protein
MVNPNELRALQLAIHARMVAPKFSRSEMSGSSDMPGFMETEYAKRGLPRTAGGRASLISVFDRQIVQKHDADLDRRSGESRRQRFERIRRTDGGDRRAVQRLFPGAHFP